MIVTDSYAENRAEQHQLDKLLELLAEKDRKLEAATYRVGFLESQISERQKEIAELDTAVKLLTDARHKSAWWRRFGAWLIGR